MQGLIALAGSGEYLPVMDQVDRELLASVQNNGRKPQVVCLPTAAGREGKASVERWMRMGKEHFEALGAEVEPLPIIDPISANHTAYRDALERADLIYLSGGNPTYLYQTLQGSLAWEAIQKAWKRGAVYAGCSAGAMILARRVPDLRSMNPNGINGFGIIGAEYVMPHFNHAGPFKYFINLLRTRLGQDQYLLGVDEETALVGRTGGEWRAMGAGRVHVLSRDADKNFGHGEVVPIPGKGEQ